MANKEKPDELVKILNKVICDIDATQNFVIKLWR